MSFSSKIKEELAEHFATARHCNLAELSAIVRLSGIFADKKNGGCALRVHMENFGAARKCFTLLRKTFNIRTEISIRRNLSKQNTSYWLLVKKHEEALRLLQAAKLLTQEGDVLEELSIVRNTVVQQYCCRRAFIRGAFLVSGSISDPEKSYHYEIVCSAKGKAEQLQKIINSFGIDAKVILRKKSYVVYVKEGAQISDLLNIMEAHVALMKFENIRILKDMRNAVNRKVNCETANINKTVSAAVKQIEDIRYIRDTIGLENLAEALKEVALTRLSYPEATLKELGDLLTPPVGKSGVNHRLRKLGEIADKLRQNKEVHYD